MDEAAFGELFLSVEVPLRRALVSWYGPTIGRDATAAALGWAWEHSDRLDDIDNVAGYLFRVGQSAARRDLRTTDSGLFENLADHSVEGDSWFEPALVPALASLSEQQRTAVLLVHGYGYTYREAADTLSVSLATLRTHVERGLRRLRQRLEIPDDA